MISLSTKLWTVDRISCWTSVRSVVCASRAIADLLGSPASPCYPRVWSTVLRPAPCPRSRRPTGASVQPVSTSDDSLYRGDPQPTPPSDQSSAQPGSGGYGAAPPPP